ncbi:hypothetical protein CA13_52130 [Planctomycetes bacterium CA13]|uniref:Uncharacterized protein n=1 Tax=Novipirellula herctigrandis TaxID=2527986 RepID=A0A5C5Z9H8_9BACT|nr:hypothetical protein CA13_52130 [Planctomycetes bacterium CA13]
MLQHLHQWANQLPSWTLRLLVMIAICTLAYTGKLRAIGQTWVVWFTLAAIFTELTRAAVIFGGYLCSSRPNQKMRLRENLDDPRMEELVQAYDASKQTEDRLECLYRHSACAAEDVIRANAIRLKAEIDLVRYQSGPRTWQEEMQHDLG